ncbi:Fe-S protein assembly co-chaperone HscB [Aquabacterium sp.]|uniref:Fe-S protein assembly co-chaperone HscB n=1 Tax=Aquabacterium sp. TaxID=1872578 RepID=UPI002D1BB065|nr:Fe-S protein assembly co-chaperone HscB [Aquabacterium sp.]HSW03257.1 Fe-S protein assembly co-chaperone HscB [Aquabacterium sp.]
MKIDDDDFTLFGLEPRFALDPALLDDRWRALQAEVHPDRFVSEGAAAQRLAMQWAVRVNEAYRRLKNPLKRGAYLCELRGAPIEAENNTAMPPAFLMQQMAWREALDDAEGAAAVEALDRSVAQHEATLIEQLRLTLDEQQDAPAAAAQVRALMFVHRFRDDIHRRLEALDA